MSIVPVYGLLDMTQVTHYNVVDEIGCVWFSGTYHECRGYCELRAWITNSLELT